MDVRELQQIQSAAQPIDGQSVASNTQIGQDANSFNALVSQGNGISNSGTSFPLPTSQGSSGGSASAGGDKQFGELVKTLGKLNDSIAKAGSHGEGDPPASLRVNMENPMKAQEAAGAGASPSAEMPSPANTAAQPEAAQGSGQAVNRLPPSNFY